MRERKRWPVVGRGAMLAVAAMILGSGGRNARAADLGGPDAPPPHSATTASAQPTWRRPSRAVAYLAVPLDSTLYDDLEHFRALGFWRGSLEMRPIRRQVFTQAAATIRAAAGEHHLSSGDERRLRRLEAAAARWAGSQTPSHARPPGDAGDAGEAGDDPPARAELAVSLNFVGNAAGLDSLANLDRRLRREQFVTVSADACVGSAAFMQWRFYEDYDRLTPFLPGDRWSDNLPPDPRAVLTSPSARNDMAVIGAGWSWGDIRLGREDRHWGTGRRGTLFLSENPFPLDGISARFQTRYIAGSSLLAQRRRGNDRAPAAESKVDSKDDAPATVTTGDAWFAAHRIELRPPGPARIGIFEAVSWAGRGIDLAYANPVAFLVAVTQDLFDRSVAAGDPTIDDKKVIGFDFAADVAPVSLYGEVLINRIVTLDMDQGPKSEATTWAQLTGLRYANPFGLDGADLDLEYAHLDPEVYYHKDRDPGMALLSEGELLGHWLGPNADSFHARLAMPVGARFGRAGLWFEHSRWGVIDGQLGTEIGFFGLRKQDKEWITGEIAEERIFGAEWRHEELRLPAGLVLDAGTRLARVDRSGMGQRDGWQAELRLTCRAARQVGA